MHASSCSACVNARRPMSPVQSARGRPVLRRPTRLGHATLAATGASSQRSHAGTAPSIPAGGAGRDRPYPRDHADPPYSPWDRPPHPVVTATPPARPPETAGVGASPTVPEASSSTFRRYPRHQPAEPRTRRPGRPCSLQFRPPRSRRSARKADETLRRHSAPDPEEFRRPHGRRHPPILREELHLRPRLDLTVGCEEKGGQRQ